MMRRTLSVAAFALCTVVVYSCAEPGDSPLAPVSGLQRSAAIQFVTTNRRVAANFYHGCALDSLYAAWCWGYVPWGELGAPVNGSESNVPVKVIDGHTFTAITAGVYHNCALEPDGDAWCWGKNNSRAILGGGITGASSMHPVLVPGGHAFVQISANYDHTCAVTGSHKLFCWGDNPEGELGDGTIGTWSPVEQIGADREWMMVAAGIHHTCALTTDSLAFCWGANDALQLGINDTATHKLPRAVRGNHHFARITAHSWHTCALDGDGKSWCWGRNAEGELGNNATRPFYNAAPQPAQGGHTYTEISAGYTNTCALSKNGYIWCWGSDGNGASGYTGDDSVPRKVPGTRLFSTIGTGAFVSCAQALNRQYFCMGGGTDGSLGNGADTVTRSPSRVKKIVGP